MWPHTARPTDLRGRLTAAIDSVLSERPVGRVRSALEGAGESAWIVGGTIRDSLLHRRVTDVDVAVMGDAEAAARRVAEAIGGPVFPLSEAFGAWRAIDPRDEFVCDVSPLHGGDIDADLAQRDFTVNAMALPIDGGELVDPHGGRRDLGAGVLRVLGEHAYAADPLRPLRLARLAAELPLVPDADTERLTRAAASRVTQASGERVFAELRRLLAADRALAALELADRLGLVAAVLPEVEALRGVEQSQFHHLDVHRHTIDVLRNQIELERRLGEVFGDDGAAVGEILERPLADEMTRREGLRLAALLHDVAKPATRGTRPDGRVTFIGHDALGAEVVTAICRRLRTSARVAQFLAAITRHHLVLGFLVHERPLARAAVYRYLTTCDPVEVEVTVLSCADRLATRGRGAEAAIEAHLELAREMMPHALRWRAEGPPRPPVRGDELAAAVGIDPGPELGELLARLRVACFTGEVATRDEAIAYARRLRNNPQR